MRIAAGVLLIIVAIFNGIAGSGYALAGGAGSIAEDAVKKAAEEQAKAGTELTEEQKKANEVALAAAKDAGGAAGGLAILGIFLLVMLGLQIAGAVTLFMSKAAGFVLIVGVLGIAAELAGPLAFSVAFGVTNIIGLVASLLAIVASRGYAGKAAAA